MSVQTIEKPRVARPILDIPTYSLAERDRRWKLARELMEQQKVDALIVYGDREGSFPAPFAHDTYFTNDRPGAIVIFPREGEPISIVAFPMAVADQMEARLRHEAVWIEPANVFAGKRGATLVELLKSCPRPRVLILAQNPPRHKVAKYMRMLALTDFGLEQNCSSEN